MEVDDSSELVNRCDEGPQATNRDILPCSSSSSLTAPCAAVSAAVTADPPHCRHHSSPLLSVLLASVAGDHRDDELNAQSILEDHLLRVWDETCSAAAALSTCSSSSCCRCRAPRDETCINTSADLLPRG